MSDDRVRIPAQRAVPSAERSCRCGHGPDAHEHFRSGSDCSFCGCERYRSVTAFAEQLVTVLRRGR